MQCRQGQRQHRRADGTLEADGWALGRVVFLANVTGQPALTLPINDGMPAVGLQLIGRPYGDARVLDIAAAVIATSHRGRPLDRSTSGVLDELETRLSAALETLGLPALD